MFSLFKRKAPGPAEATFKTRVQQFWDWYTEVSPRFFQVIEDKKCPSLAPEVSAKVDELIPGFAWVFGPGTNKKGHSFTLSGEGNFHRQLLTLYWLDHAPKLPGWTFYAARQPDSIKGHQIKIAGNQFNPIEFWLTPIVDSDEKRIDITVWHPLFDSMEERQRWTVLFLFLDEVLGEYGTQQWIGEIKLNPGRLADSIPLEEFGEFVKRLQSENDWKKLPPGETYVAYSNEKQHNQFPRGDVLFGSTMHMLLINEYLEAEGELEDPLRDTGADYVFLGFDVRILPKGKEVEVRSEIEDALEKALKASASGRLLGGAFGTRNAYIDLMLFDGRNSLDIVKRVIAEKGLPAGSSINYFAKEKRGHRIVI